MFKTGLLIAGMALGIATGTATGNVYPLTGIVTETDEKTDTVHWSDGNNEWYFYGIEDWMEGDGISVIMCDNGTETVTDDYMVGNPRYWNPDVLEGAERNHGKLD